jgi:hypothetical protein
VGGMAKIRDRTEDFKDAVRHTAVSLGYNEVKKIVSFPLSNYVLLNFVLCGCECGCGYFLTGQIGSHYGVLYHS